MDEAALVFLGIIYHGIYSLKNTWRTSFFMTFSSLPACCTHHKVIGSDPQRPQDEEEDEEESGQEEES